MPLEALVMETLETLLILIQVRLDKIQVALEINSNLFLVEDILGDNIYKNLVKIRFKS